MTDSGLPLTQQAFMNFLLGEYQPSARERIGATDTTYLPGTTYPHICQTRCWLLYHALLTHLDLPQRSACLAVLDVGPYPGTQARVLAQLLKGRLRIAGAGLTLQPSFASDMADTLVTMEEVDLDPFYADAATPIRITGADQSFDAIYALEIFEHFISPIPFLSETARLLKPGAILCLSTPNVAHVGAVYRLLRGQSNYEGIDQSPMYQMHNKWRGHSRTYAKDELIDLGKRFGLECIDHRFYVEAGARYLASQAASPVKTWVRHLIGALVPRMRDDQFLVFRNAPTQAGAGQAAMPDVQPPQPSPAAHP